MKVIRITTTAMLMAIAIVLSILEGFIPSFGVPGVKLGLANIAILIVLYEFGIIDALIVNLGRVFLASLIRGGIFTMGFWMSFAGALVSLGVMFLLKILFKKFSLVGVSIVGAIFHVVAQIFVGVIFLQTWELFFYLPILLLTSLVTGIFVGVVAKLIINTKVISKLKERHNL